MSIICSPSIKNGYIHFSVSGSPQTENEMSDYIKYLYEEAHKKAVTKLLIDETNARIPFDAHKFVISSKAISSINSIKKNVRIALLCAPHSIELYKFFEPSFTHNLFKVMAFQSEDKAVAWLLQDET